MAEVVSVEAMGGRSEDVAHRASGIAALSAATVGARGASRHPAEDACYNEWRC